MGIRSVLFDAITKLVRACGYDLVKRNYRYSADMRLITLLRHHEIDLVFDVGANAGQYGATLRALGYAGRILSFEPLSSAFATLQERARKDRHWDVLNVGLGHENSQVELNVSGNSQSSSILEMLPAHVAAAPRSAYVDTEAITVRTVDSIVDENRCDARIFLKIDTQGYERKVLDGSSKSLHRITGIQIETSLVPLYEGETLFKEMLDYVEARGFTLHSLEYGFGDPLTGRLLQVDCIFFREKVSVA